MADDCPKYYVEPFDGSNFAMWSRRVEAIFAAKEFDQYLFRESDNAKIKEVRDEKKAYALLLTLINNQILASLFHERSTKQIWDKLKLTYTKDGAVSQILVRKRLATLKKKKETSMRQHIDGVLKLVSDLRMTGVEVKDTEIVVYTLMSLSSEYEPIRAAIENLPSEKLCLEFVIQRLIDAEALMKDCKDKFSNESTSSKNHLPTVSDNLAFTSFPKDYTCFRCKTKGHKAKDCRKKIVCFNCGKSGHFKRDCKNNLRESRKQESAAITFVAGDVESNTFIVDSGATSHMCSHKGWFSDLKSYGGTVQSAARSSQMEVAGIGSIKGEISNGIKVTLENVLYVPSLNTELIAVKNMQAAGYTVIFKDGKVVINKGKSSVIFGHLNHRGQYVSNFKPYTSVALTAEESNASLWHRRMGHSSNPALKEMGLPISDAFCEVCVMAKQVNTPMGKGPRHRETEPMILVHTDVCGPVNPVTVEGERYFVTLVDDFSRFVEVCLLKHKNELVEKLRPIFKANPQIRRVRCDNAAEYVSGDFAQMMKQAGIIIDPAPPYTPSLNGVAERANRSLLEKGRALIFESNLPKSHWGHAILTAAYLKNRISSTSIDNKIPFYLRFGEEPDLTKIRVFGCDSYMRIPDSLRKKLDPKSKKVIFIGYTKMGYRLWDPISGRAVVSRNVKFNEQKRPNVSCTSAVSNELSECQEEKDKRSICELKRPERDKKPPKRLQDYEVYEALIDNYDELLFEDVSTLPESQQILWNKAMDEEIQSMKDNKVWNLVNLPEGKKPISCKWVLRQKRDGKYKARLVALGYMQKEGLDYNETFSPVINMSALRIVLVVAIQSGFKLFALDVKTAFLNGDLEEDIYMNQPKGYNDNSGQVCKLKRSLYGLKQSPRQWNERFINFAKRIQFRPLISEPCILIRKRNNQKVIMALYVDDLLIAGADTTEIDVIINLLKSEFAMSKSELATEFLGIHLDYKEDIMLLDQEIYIKKLLKKFNMLDCKPSGTPQEVKSTSSDFQGGNLFTGPYRELIGSLLYLSTTTRPDISFAVNCFSQLQERPTDIAWNGLKKILRYLQGTSSVKLEYRKQDCVVPDLTVYVDADWGSDSHDRKSVSGYIIMLCECPIAWSVKKQNSIALSSTEAEILALGKAIQDSIWMKTIINELMNVSTFRILEDNQSAIKAVTNENICGRLKHLDIKLKFIRHAISEHGIDIQYVSSSEQLADMLTKSLPKPKLLDLRVKCKIKCD